MSNIKNKTNVLFEYLQKNHTGRKNAASGKTLEAVFNLNGKEIRKCVNTLRCDGFPVCSDTVGYYFAATQDEVDATIAQLNSRITQISNAKNGLLNSVAKIYLPIQIDICIELSVDLIVRR